MASGRGVETKPGANAERWLAHQQHHLRPESRRDVISIEPLDPRFVDLTTKVKAAVDNQGTWSQTSISVSQPDHHIEANEKGLDQDPIYVSLCHSHVACTNHASRPGRVWEKRSAGSFQLERVQKMVHNHCGERVYWFCR